MRVQLPGRPQMAKMKRWWLWFHRTDPVHLQGYITQSVANVWGGAVIWQLSPIQACRADLQYQTEPTDGAVSSLVAEYGERTVVSTFPGAGQQTSIENSPKNIRLQEGVSGCTGWQAQYPIMGGGGTSTWNAQCPSRVSWLHWIGTNQQIPFAATMYHRYSRAALDGAVE